MLTVHSVKSSIEFTAVYGSEFAFQNAENRKIGDIVKGTGSSKVLVTANDKGIYVLEIHAKNFESIAIPSENIRNDIKQNRGKEIPIFPNYTIFCALVAKRLSGWEDPTFQLLKSTFDMVASVWKSIVKSLDIKPKLAKFLLSEGETVLAKLFENTKLVVKKELLREFHDPYTLNHYLSDILIKMRNKALLDSISGVKGDDGKADVNVIVALLEQHGVGTASNEEREVIEMQFALSAYIKVAGKRFIDNIPMLIERELIDSFKNTIFVHLKSKDDPVLMNILSDAKNVEINRKILLDKESALSKAEVQIDSLLY